MAPRGLVVVIALLASLLAAGDDGREANAGALDNATEQVNYESGAGAGSIEPDAASLVNEAVQVNSSEFHVLASSAARVEGHDASSYDCDSDGVKDCGTWDYTLSQCANQAKCEHHYKFMDLSLGQSCRCRPHAITPGITDYDCDGDGEQDCGRWTASLLQCRNLSRCHFKYKFLDLTLGQSCRCRKKPLDESPEPSYDCNNDGSRDCGKWDYSMGMCKNQNMCIHNYKFLDLTLDQSCRCQRCAGGSGAEVDPVLKAPANSNLRVPFKALYWGTFRNWADHLNTCSPWLMPKHDDDIRALLQYARTKGYKVRISGAGHSAGGIVTDGQDPNVLVVSLAEYTAPGEWEFGLRDMPDGSKRATINAGLTLFHLYERIRPLGFFVPAQTAGYFFSLGGVVANSVHGGGYGDGFIHGYTTRMRVMTHDGTVKIIDDEDEVRFWRCSFGLLGIILGVEMRLERREQLEMYVTERHLRSWSPDQFWEFIKQDAEADLPPDAVPTVGASGSRKSFNGEFFVDFINGGHRPKIAVYVKKANRSVDVSFSGTLGIPTDVQKSYAEIRDQTVTDGRHGDMTWGQAARRFGAPPVKIVGINVNDMLGVLQGAKRTMASVMSREAIGGVERRVRRASDRVNDGFFLTRSPAALASAFFIKPSDAFRAMDFLRQVQLDSRSSDEFVWNLPGEFRFVGVQDTAVLQPVPAGVWFSAEMMSFPDLAKNSQAWKKAFKKVQDFWVNELGAKPHMGKLFGFEASASGQVEPFGDAFSCSIYSDAAKDQFEAYRASQDPDGLFATGLGMKFLKKC